MRSLHGTYVHRGDRVRRWRKIRQATLFAVMVMLAGVLVSSRQVAEAQAGLAEAPAAGADVPFYLRGEARRLHAQLDSARGELAVTNAQLERANRIMQYSARFRISADLAASILDIALAEGIEPELAFRLVRVESEFNERATSPVGAVGLTQLMPATARWFEKGITRAKLYDRDTNLRIGFRYLRALIREHDGDVALALLVYNRGPVAVAAQRQLGRDPSNGYDRAVMRGYTGNGVVE